MRIRRPASIVTLVLVLGLLPTGAALAAIHTNTTGAGTILTVTGGKANERVTVECDGGIKVNNDVPDDGPIACATIVSLHISLGDGNDELDITDLNATDTPNLTDIEVNFGNGNDIGSGSFIAEKFIGGKGNDGFNSLPGNDTTLGGPGVDGVTDQGGTVVTLTNTFMDGGGGHDTISGIEKASIIVGSGGAAIDTSTFSGNVFASTASFSDSITTGPGDDKILSGSNNDLILSGKGDDVIQAGPGGDTLSGQDGRDTLNGGPDIDSCDGGAGRDTLKNCE